MLILSAALTASAARDTVSVYFPFNKSSLTKEASQQLDSAIYNRTINERYPVKIIGYADEVGGNQYNLRLSKERAASVKTYLIQSGFRADRIVLITGKGESAAQAAAGPDGTPADRRVDVVMDKTAAPPPVPTAAIEMSKAPTAELRKASVTDISSVAPGESLLLDKIYFYPGRHIVRPESNVALDALYKSLQSNPGIRIKIEGHVCCVPTSEPDAVDDDTFKKELSLNRARVIREYLMKRGIDPSRIQYEGFGSRRRIINPETTEEEANQNRRVEIRVIP